MLVINLYPDTATVTFSSRLQMKDHKQILKTRNPQNNTTRKKPAVF